MKPSLFLGMSCLVYHNAWALGHLPPSHIAIKVYTIPCLGKIHPVSRLVAKRIFVMPPPPLSTLGYVLLPPVLVLPNGRKVRLTLGECRLFALLEKAFNNACSRAFICQALGLPVQNGSRRVDALVHRLRKKMGKYGASIVSRYGIGYAFDPSCAPKKTRYTSK